MAFIKKSIIFLAVFVGMDLVIGWLNNFVDAGYNGIFEMLEEYYVNQQELKDVVFNTNTLFLSLPLTATYYITRTNLIRKI